MQQKILFPGEGKQTKLELNETNQQCMKCLLPPDAECQICNGNTSVELIEVIGAEIIKAH